MTTFKAFAAVAAIATGAASLWCYQPDKTRHLVLSKLLHFESASVVTHNVHSLVVFHKGDSRHEFPGGKVEVKDLRRGLLIWLSSLRMGLSWALFGVFLPIPSLRLVIAAECAQRETLEETGQVIHLIGEKPIVELGKGETATGEPVVWFIAPVTPMKVPGSDPIKLTYVAEGAENKGAIELQTIDDVTIEMLRPFNKMCVAGLRDGVNNAMGREMIKVTKPIEKKPKKKVTVVEEEKKAE